MEERGDGEVREEDAWMCTHAYAHDTHSHVLLVSVVHP